MSEEAGTNIREAAHEEKMAALYESMMSEASSQEAEARDLEDRMLLLRARAASLRTGAGGIQAAIQRWHEERERANAFREKRDHVDTPDPDPEPDPYARTNYADHPDRKINVVEHDWRSRG